MHGEIEGRYIIRDLNDVAERWNGAAWRWWALAAGLGLVVATAGIAWLVVRVAGESFPALLSLALLAELLLLSLLGSGLMTGTSRRMSRGGLARETATIDIDHRSPEEREADKERDRAAKDRRTIRMGIMALPVALTLIYLLAR